VATTSGQAERQSSRDTSDNQKRLACGTNRDDLALAIGRRTSILIAAAVSPRLTRYTSARLGVLLSHPSAPSGHLPRKGGGKSAALISASCLSRRSSVSAIIGKRADIAVGRIAGEPGRSGVKGGVLAIAAATAVVVAFEPAAAQEPFAGKQVRVIVPAGSGASGYGLYGQLAAQHLGRSLPGNPSVVVSFMPGAAGLVAMNWLYEIAPKDGTA
jgi:hypothetical protein